MSATIEVAAQFVEKARADGTTFVCLADDAPEWVRGMVQAAHGEMMPDDTKYRLIRDAVQQIEAEQRDGTGEDEDAGDDFADREVSVYHHDRSVWLASHIARLAYCDEAQDEGIVNDATSLSDRIAAGWFLEAREVYQTVKEALAARNV